MSNKKQWQTPEIVEIANLSQSFLTEEEVEQLKALRKDHPKLEQLKYGRWDNPAVPLEKMEELRHTVWLLDVPHPGCPEYVELHDKIQIILEIIDQLMEAARS